MIQLDFKTCKNLMEKLKADKRFKIIEDDRIHNAGSDGVDCWGYTILEAQNLKIIYAKYNLCDYNDIKIVDQPRNVCIYSNSPYPEELIDIDKMEKLKLSTLDELMQHIETRL